MSHMKSAKLAKIQSTYVPPVFNCANNLNETINDYDSIIIVSNDLKSLPEFPHTNALNEILEKESIDYFEVIESSGIKFIISPPQKSNHKQYIEAITASLNVAKEAGLLNPLVLIHNYPQSLDTSDQLCNNIEKILHTVFVSLRPNQKDHNDTIRRNKKHSVKTMTISPPLSPKSNEEPIKLDIDNSPVFFNLQGTPSRALWFIKEFDHELYSQLKIVNLKSLKELKTYFSGEEVISNNVPIIRLSKDLTLWDSGSIISYLIDKRRREGNLTLEWSKEQWHLHNFYSYWTVATLDQKISEGSRFQELIFGSKTQWWKNCERKIVEDLGDNDYIQSNEFSITDIFVGYSVHLAHTHGMLKNANPKILEYYKKISSREAFKTFVLLTSSSESKDNEAKASTNEERNTSNEEANENEEKAEEVNNESEGKNEEENTTEQNNQEAVEVESKKEDQEVEESKKEDQIKLIKTVGFHLFDAKGVDFTGLAKALSAIEKTTIQFGNSKVSPYEFVKRAIENDMGRPLVEEQKEE